jgi:hypothetical protein
MKFVCAFFAICGISLALGNTPSTHAGDLLFLAHFNQSIEPEVGNYDGMIRQAEITSQTLGYPFQDSVPRAEALNAGRRNSFLAFPAAGNFSTEAGTLQMLVKPQWRMDSYGHCVFFKLVFDNSNHKGSFLGINSFYLQKSPKQQVISLVQDGNSRNGNISANIPDSMDNWLHLAATWDAAKQVFCLYINGELQGSNKFRPMTKQPVEFTLGSPTTHNAQALIDEVRILKRALTAEEIRRDYEYIRSGREFSAGDAGEPRPLMTFDPIPVEKTDTGLAAQLLPIEFPAMQTNDQIVLDGVIDEPAWMNQTPITALGHRNANSKLPPPTEIRLLYHQDALLISAVLFNPDMTNHLARYDQNDQAIYSDECLEFFLDLSGSNEEFYQFAVNSIGAVYDAKGGNSRWNGRGVKVATKRFSDRWTVEMQIPFAALNRPTPLPGEFWGVRLGREHHHGTPAVSIPVVQSGSFNQRHYLGKLVFTAGTGDANRELTCKNNHFLLGVNRLNLQLKGSWPEEIIVQSSLFANDNKLFETLSSKFSYLEHLSVPVTVSDDRVCRIVLQVQDSQKKTLGTVVLNRDFPYVHPGLSELGKEAAALLESLGQLRTLSHPIYQGACQSLQRIQLAISQFQSQMEQAIAADKTVPLDEIEKITSLANGFQHFRRKNQYLLWEVSPWENGSPTALPGKDYQFTRTIKFSQASNEREAKAFVLSGLLCGPRLDLRIVPRSSNVRNKPFLASHHFEVYAEPFINHLGDLLTAPLVQNSGNIVTVTPGEAIRVWIVFNSRGLPPGDYNTTVEIKPLYDFSRATESIDVDIKVWNFTLPETRDWPIDAFFWGPNNFDNDEVAMLRLMHSRHVKWGWTKSLLYTIGVERENQRGKLPEGQLFNPELVLNANQEFFHTAKELGMRIVFGWGTCNSLEWHQLMAGRLKKLGFGPGDFIFKSMIRDEFVKSDIPTNAALRKVILDAKEDWVFQAVYLSTPPPTGATLEDIEEAGLTDFFKNWAVISGFFSNSPEEGHRIAKFFRDRGCTVWVYRCNTAMSTLPILDYYRFLPWLAHTMNLPGFAIWTCMAGGGGDDGFDFRDGYDDGITRRDLHKKPVPSKHLEAVSEGLEDIAYIVKLKELLAQAGDSLPPEKKTYLHNMISVRLPEIMNNCSQSEVDAWRQEVGEAIDALSKKAMQPN